MPEVDERARVRESTISLPTYAIKGANRNPVFGSRYGVAHIYPYTLLDDIDTRAADQIYHTLILENSYLRVTVIPDLGGRVYSVFDKVSKREVFYKNSVVRFAPLAIRGAFFSGGVEFSFPVAHAPTTCDKVNWDMGENSDGSASISIGGLEHISGLRWTITLTLYPDRCALAQDVRLFNPGALPGRYHYWTNASLDANDATEFIYPFHRARSYEYAGTASWPFARLDLIQDEPGLPGMEGVPMWPADRLQRPVNFRWQKNMLAQVSVFGRHVEYDYFGAWQHTADHGYAHVARRQDVAGMKLWSWGNAPVGVVNQTALTDDGSVYAETQCGAMETQLDFDFLQPGCVRAWREWWIPLRGIGGLTCASEAAGARFSLAPGGDGQTIQLVLGVCPAVPVGNATIRASVPGQVLLEQRCSMSPTDPWLGTATISAAELADKPITLLIADSAGKTLLENTLTRDADKIDTQCSNQDPPADADDRYRLGLKYENFDNRDQARQAFLKAVEMEPGDGRPHLRLGLMLLRAVNLGEAEKHLARAEELGVGDSSYFRGLIAMQTGRLSDAEQQFRRGQTSESHAAASTTALGKLKLRHQKWEEAVGFFQQASGKGAGSESAHVLLAVALRQAGRLEEARTVLGRILENDPLNHIALHEMTLGHHPGWDLAAKKLERMLADDDQYFLDLAGFYTDAGLPREALELVASAWSCKQDPVVAYVGAFLSHKLGDGQSQSTWLGRARAAVLDFAFPSRPEEVLALQFALEQEPTDSNAKYLLGTFFYAHGRHAEAIQLWIEALEELGSYDVLLRNLGIAAWQQDKNNSAAIGWFEKALAANPANQDIYLHLDDLYKAENLIELRQQLLKRIEQLPHVREDVHKRQIAMMVELGRHEDAIELLTTETFVPLEMDQSFHEVYVRALMKRAQEHLAAGRIPQAIEDYQAALQYPENLGVGAPTTRAQAELYYSIGIAFEKLGQYPQALAAWYEAASEHHPYGTERFAYVQMALDKLSRYSEMGLDG